VVEKFTAFQEAVVRACPQAILAVDENLVVRILNRSAEKLLGVESAGIVGRHVGEGGFLGQSVFQDLQETVQTGEDHNSSYYLFNEEGQRVLVNLHTSRIADGDGNCLGAMLVIEEPASGIDCRQFELILDCIEEGVIVIDADQRVVIFNRAAGECYSLESRNVVGRDFAEVLSVVPLEDQLVIRTVTLGEEFSKYHHSYVVGGRKRSFVSDTAKLTDEKGKLTGAIQVFREITALQEQERVENAERLTLIKQIAFGVAHNMRNPLTSVRGFVQVVQEKAAENAISDISEFARVALKEIDRVNELIGDFLHLADTFEVRKEPANINSLLDSIYVFIKGKAALSGVVVTREPARELPSVSVDVVQIIQVFFSIIDNALEAMQAGGQLTIRTYYLSHENKVGIDFSDTGPGIPAHLLKDIFNPFFVIREEGTGFGLAIANKIVFEHGGELKVKSEVGKGTTFSVYLPVQ